MKTVYWKELENSNYVIVSKQGKTISPEFTLKIEAICYAKNNKLNLKGEL